MTNFLYTFKEYMNAKHIITKQYLHQINLNPYQDDKKSWCK